VDGITADPEIGQEGPSSSPSLLLDGYTGTLERLLALARAHQVDLARLSLPDLCDQLGAALARAGDAVPLSQRGAWLVMAAWLLQLRSRLLLPADASAMKAADADAGRLRGRLAELRHVQALAAWLDGRPQLGRDVFARGRPEWVGPVGGPEHQVDVIEFLWASLALFDADLPAAGTTASYRPAWRDLYSVPDARERIRRLLTATPKGAALGELLPEPVPDMPPPSALKRRSAWTSTFVASLELAKQGEVGLEQERAFAAIRVQHRAGVCESACYRDPPFIRP